MSLSLRQRLRASHVKRWHIVETTKQQTVAEHSYNVWVFAEAICDVENINCEHTRCQVIEYALHHDLPEVVLGDVPTPSKALVNMKRVEIDIYPRAAPPNDLVRDIVKLADVMDAILFLALYGVGKHAALVREERVNFGRNLAKNIGDAALLVFNIVCPWRSEQLDGVEALWPTE